jgi:hypothetical protein
MGRTSKVLTASFVVLACTILFVFFGANALFVLWVLISLPESVSSIRDIFLFLFDAGVAVCLAYIIYCTVNSVRRF